LSLFDEIDLEITHLKNLFDAEGPYVVGLRPNDLRLGDEGKSGMLSFSPVAMLSEIIGSETIVYLKHKSFEMRMLVPKLVKYEGHTIKVCLDPSKIYVFGKQTGDLICKYSKN
jgi:ABC-type sugar transport system ATPase subunit